MISGDSTLARASSRDESHALFGQTMGLVAVTAGLFAFGAYLGRNMSPGWILVWWIASFACLFGINFAVRQSEESGVGLLFVFGLLVGLASAPTIAYYADTNSAPPGTRLGGICRPTRGCSSGP